jgi:4a-hydroxytetrahydrobiopterin dehydratase
MKVPLKKKDWSSERRRSMTATELVTHLAKLEGWRLTGDGPTLAIEKLFSFVNYYETMAFVNAVALVAHIQDHHPELSVQYGQCKVCFNTHDVLGISSTDFDCAAQIDALLT